MTINFLSNTSLYLSLYIFVFEEFYLAGNRAVVMYSVMCQQRAEEEGNKRGGRVGGRRFAAVL